MEPVDKIKARADALADLGLDQCAGSDDIRDAWRRIAFHAHPDHTGGECANFSRAKMAYDFLRKEGLTAKGPTHSGQRMPRRPRVKKRIIELPQEDIATCKAMLNPDRALPHMPVTGDTQSDTAPCSTSDHVPDAVGCYGRHLTYFVATPVCEGANRVALPTSVLTSARHTETEVLSFQSKDTGAGEVVVPEPIRERKFPGAKSVRIRFEADQDIRDEFGLTG
ncbi:J domain-containing protein [Rhodobacteraceae bacterium B1Z28]|uniref:J domain-containing protein n=1 Tax=Ruegeria haliotis TaxID=2747601 RepID=A0ABX2PLU4_9RHOB|nr:J domain-containing protein [Ruegeria haliotis]NVO54441.1 J domain-containing protein [Ruegeria haliotis]